MAGANCSIYGCGTSRKHVGVSIFRIPTKDDELSKKTRDAWVRVVCRDREIDASLRNQISQRTIHICEKHFEKNLIETCKFYSYHLAIYLLVVSSKCEQIHSVTFGNQQSHLHIYKSCVQLILFTVH